MKNLDFNVGTHGNCKNSIYIDKDIGHVLTGNLNIIKDRKLRKLIQKGPSYREQNNINWNTNLKNCIKAIKEYKTKWARREKVDTRVLNEWEGTVTSIVKLELKESGTNINNPIGNIGSKYLEIRHTLNT